MCTARSTKWFPKKPGSGRCGIEAAGILTRIRRSQFSSNGYVSAGISLTSLRKQPEVSWRMSHAHYWQDNEENVLRDKNIVVEGGRTADIF